MKNIEKYTDCKSQMPFGSMGDWEPEGDENWWVVVPRLKCLSAQWAIGSRLPHYWRDRGERESQMPFGSMGDWEAKALERNLAFVGAGSQMPFGSMGDWEAKEIVAEVRKAGSLKCLSAQWAIGRSRFLKTAQGRRLNRLKCLSAQWAIGSKAEARWGKMEAVRVSNAFRLNGRLGDSSPGGEQMDGVMQSQMPFGSMGDWERGEAARVHRRRCGVSNAFRLNGRLGEERMAFARHPAGHGVSNAFRLNGRLGVYHIFTCAGKGRYAHFRRLARRSLEKFRKLKTTSLYWRKEG